MVRPGRDRLTGRVEVDETYLGGLEEGVRGRQTERKSLIVIAAQEDGPGIGRIRMKRIPDASANSLMDFVKEAIEPGSTVHTDGWLGYDPLEGRGYAHEITFLKGKKESASELMPRVHRIASLLKRWILGTHQGAVSHEHLEYYLDEFTFRFNRRRSSESREALLPPGTAGSRHRSRPVQVHGQMCRWGRGVRPQPVVAHLSEVNTHLTKILHREIVSRSVGTARGGPLQKRSAGGRQTPSEKVPKGKPCGVGCAEEPARPRSHRARI